MIELRLIGDRRGVDGAYRLDSGTLIGGDASPQQVGNGDSRDDEDDRDQYHRTHGHQDNDQRRVATLSGWRRVVLLRLCLSWVGSRRRRRLRVLRLSVGDGSGGYVGAATHAEAVRIQRGLATVRTIFHRPLL